MGIPARSAAAVAVVACRCGGSGNHAIVRGNPIDAAPIVSLVSLGYPLFMPPPNYPFPIAGQPFFAGNEGDTSVSAAFAAMGSNQPFPASFNDGTDHYTVFTDRTQPPIFLNNDSGPQAGNTRINTGDKVVAPNSWFSVTGFQKNPVFNDDFKDAINKITLAAGSATILSVAVCRYSGGTPPGFASKCNVALKA